MGYSTTYHNGRQVYVCDGCGAGRGTTRKRRCPFGYCPPSYFCPDCMKKPGRNAGSVMSRKNHRAGGCETGHAKYAAQAAVTATRLAAGESLRVSAIGLSLEGRYTIHVLFANGKRETIGYYMTATVYDSIPLGVDAAPDDYRKHGELLPAPSEFSFGGVTKEVGAR